MPGSEYLKNTYVRIGIIAAIAILFFISAMRVLQKDLLRAGATSMR